MSRGRSKWLAEQVNEHKYLVGAEVGAAIGLTAKHVLDNCPSLKQYLVVDDWRPIPGSGIFDDTGMKQKFYANVKSHQKRLKVLEGISWNMANLVDYESLDFLFLDASHDYGSVVKDLEAWIPKVRPGGLLSGHDEHWEGVSEALNDLKIDYKLAGIDNVWYKLL